MGRFFQSVITLPPSSLNLISMLNVLLLPVAFGSCTAFSARLEALSPWYFRPEKVLQDLMKAFTLLLHCI